MNVLFCGGGTVGHISPALAIAEEFIKRDPSCKVAFVGRADGRENEVITKKGYMHYEIHTQGLIRKLTFKNLKAVKGVFDAEKEARAIIENFKPDAVIGTGGYVSFPVIRAARRLGIITAIHESNSTLGLASKLLARGCDAVFLGTRAKNKLKNAVYTGNPVRAEFYKASKIEARVKLGIPKDAFFILSVGGSLGAEALNGACIKMMRSLGEEKREIFHFHSTGARYFEKARAIYPEFCRKNSQMRILPYIEDMPAHLAAADLVITRCGAMTLSEIAASGAPSILIPSPNVSANHQMKNALYFVEMGAGVIINESDLSESTLLAVTKKLMNDDQELKQMSTRAKKLCSENAAAKIVKDIEKRIAKRREQAI